MPPPPRTPHPPPTPPRPAACATRARPCSSRTAPRRCTSTSPPPRTAARYAAASPSAAATPGSPWPATAGTTPASSRCGRRAGCASCLGRSGRLWCRTLASRAAPPAQALRPAAVCSRAPAAPLCFATPCLHTDASLPRPCLLPPWAAVLWLGARAVGAQRARLPPHQPAQLPRHAHLGGGIRRQQRHAPRRHGRRVHPLHFRGCGPQPRWPRCQLAASSCGSSAALALESGADLTADV